MTISTSWFLDTSVVARGVIEMSRAVDGWLLSQAGAGTELFASRLLEVELLRLVKNSGMEPGRAALYLDLLTLEPLDDALASEAIAIAPPVTGADSLHLAAALRLGTDRVAVATHDAQMARAAAALGFEVHDPVTDDPRRPPVA